MDSELLQASQRGIPTSKTTIRRAINKVTSKFNILEKVIKALKEAILLTEDEQETDIVIKNLDKEVVIGEWWVIPNTYQSQSWIF